MRPDISRHPCFNKDMRHTYGRVHLPVAPACNVQCRFCNRKYDCVNESRPGVTSAVLRPRQALAYLAEVYARRPETAVVGIAGPGDPFANPEATLETLRLVRDHYPEMLLCVASNGLNVTPYVDELAELAVSHVTITVNAVDHTVGAGVYRWFRHGTRVLRGEEGAGTLLRNQMEAIRALKERNIIVKVNSIVIPGVNDGHIGTIARTMQEYGVDIFNCMPLLPAAGSDFADLDEPSAEMMARVRNEAGAHIPQMTHCARCRADAAGRIGEENDEIISSLLQGCCSGSRNAVREEAPYVAAATMEGALVNLHLGNAFEFSVFKNTEDGPALVERRQAPLPGGGDFRWEKLADILHDCGTVLAQFAGERPRAALEKRGIGFIAMEGLIDTALRELFAGRPVPAYMTARAPRQCGAGCGGGGGGCGA